MTGSLLKFLNLHPPDTSKSTDVRARPREHALAIDARSSFGEYLQVRDAAGDAKTILAALEEAERDLAAWREELQDDGPSDQRQKLELVAERLGIERAEFDSLRRGMEEVDALVSKRESAQDVGLRLELQRQIEAAFLSLSR